MLNVDKFTHKPFFDREPDPCKPPHEKPRYTMTEEVEHTARLMRDTIDRLLRFEERVKNECADLARNLTSDNVIFKNSMHEAWQTFLMEAKNEINVFEGNIEADLRLFKSDIETNYGNILGDVDKKLDELEKNVSDEYEALVSSVNARLEQYNDNHGNAFADYQRTLNTQLSTFEAGLRQDFTDFSGSTRSSLEAFMETWEGVITERLAEQDNKISDSEMYMKTNLGAGIADKVEEMHTNGELAGIIEGELFADLTNKSKLEYHNATADPVACAEFCRETGRTFYVPAGVAIRISEPLDLTGIDVEINGEVIVEHHGVGVIVGERNGVKRNRRKIYVNAITHEDGEQGDVSLRIVGVWNARVEVGSAIAVELYADGDGVEAPSYIAYSEFSFAKVQTLTIHDKPGTTNPGWINENVFMNCRVQQKLSIIGNTYAHNNNVFYKPCLENATLELVNCSRNKFYDVRTEGSFKYTADERTRHNVIHYNYYFNNPSNMGLMNVDNGFCNLFVNDIFDKLERVTVYALNPKTFYNGMYLCETDHFELTDSDKLKPTMEWQNLASVKLPANHIRYLVLNSDGANFRLKARALDSSSGVVEGGISYPGATADEEGFYMTGANTGFAVVEVTDPSVAWVDVELSVGNGTFVEFLSMTLSAFVNPNRFHAQGYLESVLKANKTTEG